MKFALTPSHIRIAAGGTLLLSVLVLVTGILLPVGTTPVNAERSGPPPATHPATTESVQSSVNFSNLLDVELRRPLVDRPPTTLPGGLVANDPMLGLRLVGTIVERMHSFAVFTDSAGKTQMKSAGDSVGGRSILRIDKDSVTLGTNDRSTVLHVLKPPAIGSLPR